MINNRQNGRRRGRGGGAGGAPRPNGGNGGGAERGNRIDNRARGNAAQLHEKYKALARDSQMQGDRVATEYYLQFSDHYFRVLAESRSRFEEQQPRPRRDDYMQQDGDDDYGDEGDIAGGNQDQQPQHQREEQPAYDRAYQARDDDSRNYNGGNDSRRNEPRGNDGRSDGNRNDGSRNDGNRNDGNRGDGSRNDGGRNENSRGDGQRDDGNRGDTRRPRRDRNDGYEANIPASAIVEAAPAQPVPPRGESRGEERVRRPRRDRSAEPYIAPEPAPVAVEPVAPPPPAPVVVQEEAAPAARIRRPRRVAEPVAAEPERIEVDRLPPSFTLTPPLSDVANDSDEAVEKPRRRTRRTRTDAEG